MSRFDPRPDQLQCRACIGGFYPTLAGARTMLLDAGLPATAPAWKSERFAESGVMLRSGFPTERETQLYLIAGRNHDHYDDDSGSFTLWGKGRLLANDFGYTGRAPAEDHNMIVSPATLRGLMRVEEFATTERFDSLRGTRDGWTRQIAFVKDPDPLGNNFFVVSDTLREPAPMKWQLWLTAKRVTTKPSTGLVEGQEDVDLDIVFTAPAKLELRTEEKSRTCPGLLPAASELRTPRRGAGRSTDHASPRPDRVFHFVTGTREVAVAQTFRGGADRPVHGGPRQSESLSFFQCKKTGAAVTNIVEMGER